MSCKGNGNCPLDDQEKLDAELKALMTRMLIQKLRSELEESQNKKLDNKTELPQHKEGPGQDVVSQAAITNMVNTQAKLAPILLNSPRGFASLLILGGLAITITSQLSLGTTSIAARQNQFGQSLIFYLGLLGILIILVGFIVWTFWDPDRPERKKRGRGSGKKSQKQQNTDNIIDNSENDDDMENSIKVKVYQQIRETIIVEQERLRIKRFLIENTENLEFRELFSEYLELRMTFLKDIIVSEMGTEMHYFKIELMYSFFTKMVYSIFVDLFYKTIIEKEKNINNYHQNFKLFKMKAEKEIYNEERKSRFHSFTEKEIMNLIDYRSSSEFDIIFKAFYKNTIRIFAEQINSKRDIKMSKGRKIAINYVIDDSFQLYKEKKQIYPTLTHNYLFQIPEIKRLSQNLRVTKESNILNHKFSIALPANTNQCSTENEQIQISITNNQKTKSNKLLGKKIILNLN